VNSKAQMVSGSGERQVIGGRRGRFFLEMADRRGGWRIENFLDNIEKQYELPLTINH
jgi:hypothetical protein